MPSFLGGAPSAGAAVAPPVPVDVVLDEGAAAAWAEAEAPAREPTLRELMRGVELHEGGGDEGGFAAVEEASAAHAPSGAVEAEEAPQREPTLRELMRGVSVGGVDEGESWAFIGGGTETQAPAAEAAPSEAAPAAVVAAAPDTEAPAAEAAAPAAAPEETDACAPLRRLLDKRKNFIRRTAAERDTFGYVESEEDVAALRLLQGLHRCAQHPDDEDCRQRPIEVDINDLVVPSHQIERDPSDLNAEGRTPDEIPHDPQVLELLHQLEQCERREVVQPLLQRSRR